MKTIETDGKWVFNDSEYGIWNKGEEYETKSEAIKYGVEYAKENEWDCIFVGKIKAIQVLSPLYADDVISDTAEIIDGTTCSCDLEPGREFIDGISDEDSEHLQKLLDDAFDKWVDERNVMVRSYEIVDVEKIELIEVEL